MDIKYGSTLASLGGSQDVKKTHIIVILVGKYFRNGDSDAWSTKDSATFKNFNLFYLLFYMQLNYIF